MHSNKSNLMEYSYVFNQTHKNSKLFKWLPHQHKICQKINLNNQHIIIMIIKTTKARSTNLNPNKANHERLAKFTISKLCLDWFRNLFFHQFIVHLSRSNYCWFKFIQSDLHLLLIIYIINWLTCDLLIY